MSSVKKPQPQKVVIETKTPEVEKSKPEITLQDVGPLMFDKSNYILMIAGLVCIALGFMCMSGGASSDPNVFNAEEVYSFRRITLAPILVVLGFLIEIYAIFKGKNDAASA